MGVMVGMSSLARVLGPLAMTSVYQAKGLYVTFGIVETMTASSLILVLAFYRRLPGFQSKQ